MKHADTALTRGQRLFLSGSRWAGPVLAVSPLIAWDMAGFEVSVPFVVSCCMWCFAIGYIDRGWTEYLREIGFIK